MDRAKLLAAMRALGLPAFAQANGGWYAGFDVGTARSDAKVGEYVFLGQTTDRASGSSTAYRLRGGYRFGRFFALELTYVDFGENENENENEIDPDDTLSGAFGAYDPGETRMTTLGVACRW